MSNESNVCYGSKAAILNMEFADSFEAMRYEGNMYAEAEIDVRQ